MSADDTYFTATNSIRDAVLAIVKSTTSFRIHAYANYIEKMTGNPTAFVRLRKDRFRDVGAYETYHTITFQIQINYRSDTSEQSLADITEFAGEVVDAIEANRTLGTSYIENTEILNIDYSWRIATSAVFHYAYITIEVQALRNK